MRKSINYRKIKFVNKTYDKKNNKSKKTSNRKESMEIIDLLCHSSNHSRKYLSESESEEYESESDDSFKYLTDSSNYNNNYGLRLYNRTENNNRKNRWSNINFVSHIGNIEHLRLPVVIDFNEPLLD